MGCRPKTLLFALIEKADATRRGPTSKRMFSYGAIVANEITNNISLPFLMGWLFVATRIYIYIYIHTSHQVVLRYQTFPLFTRTSVSSYLVIERDFVGNVQQATRPKDNYREKSRTSRSSFYLSRRANHALNAFPCSNLPVRLPFVSPGNRKSIEGIGSSQSFRSSPPWNLWHRIFACFFSRCDDNGR